MLSPLLLRGALNQKWRDLKLTNLKVVRTFLSVSSPPPPNLTYLSVSTPPPQTLPTCQFYLPSPLIWVFRLCFDISSELALCTCMDGGRGRKRSVRKPDNGWLLFSLRLSNFTFPASPLCTDWHKRSKHGASVVRQSVCTSSVLFQTSSNPVTLVQPHSKQHLRLQ